MLTYSTKKLLARFDDLSASGLQRASSRPLEPLEDGGTLQLVSSSPAPSSFASVKVPRLEDFPSSVTADFGMEAVLAAEAAEQEPKSSPSVLLAAQEKDSAARAGNKGTGSEGAETAAGSDTVPRVGGALSSSSASKTKKQKEKKEKAKAKEKSDIGDDDAADRKSIEKKVVAALSTPDVPTPPPPALSTNEEKDVDSFLSEVRRVLLSEKQQRGDLRWSPLFAQAVSSLYTTWSQSHSQSQSGSQAHRPQEQEQEHEHEQEHGLPTATLASTALQLQPVEVEPQTKKSPAFRAFRGPFDDEDEDNGDGEFEQVPARSRKKAPLPSGFAAAEAARAFVAAAAASVDALSIGDGSPTSSGYSARPRLGDKVIPAAVSNRAPSSPLAKKRGPEEKSTFSSSSASSSTSSSSSALRKTALFQQQQRRNAETAAAAVVSIVPAAPASVPSRRSSSVATSSSSTSTSTDSATDSAAISTAAAPSPVFVPGSVSSCSDGRDEKGDKGSLFGVVDVEGGEQEDDEEEVIILAEPSSASSVSSSAHHMHLHHHVRSHTHASATPTAGAGGSEGGLVPSHQRQALPPPPGLALPSLLSMALPTELLVERTRSSSGGSSRFVDSPAEPSSPVATATTLRNLHPLQGIPLSSSLSAEDSQQLLAAMMSQLHYPHPHLPHQ